jgi:5'(3')-deoxyribonucleotidase
MGQKIILDVDDIVCDTTQAILDLYNKEHGVDVVINDIINYNFKGCDKIKHNLLVYFKTGEIFKTLKPNKDAVEGIIHLQNKGYEVFFATATKRPGYNARHDWLLENFTVPENNIIFCSRKDLLVADWFFDDALHNLLPNRSRNVICMDRPWNNPINHPEAKHLKRVPGFTEFVWLIEKEEEAEIFDNPFRIAIPC